MWGVECMPKVATGVHLSAPVHRRQDVEGMQLMRPAGTAALLSLRGAAAVVSSVMPATPAINVQLCASLLKGINGGSTLAAAAWAASQPSSLISVWGPCVTKTSTTK